MADDNKHSDQFDASLQLPSDGQKSAADDSSANPAADLIRKKIESAYAHEPDAKEEVVEAEETKPAGRSKHQEFIYNLTNSGRPLHEIQAAWHEYYAGLTDADKHKVWQEFYSTQAQAAHHPAVTHHPVISAPATPVLERPGVPKRRSKTAHKLSPAKSRVKENQTARKVASNRGLHSLLFGLGAGSIVIIIFLFSFFNERIIAPFIQPSRNSGNIQFISDAPVSQDPEVIIPKINVEIPVVYGVNTINDNAVETALENGV
ncbi:MAG TPA: hypothetical protein VHD84_02095, partial [Candidatus Saccharimonadales bacterium]|nr:hypothetical protein [Candidatus Saccharimonadales bacterium]